MDDLAWPIPDAMCATLFQCKMACCGSNDPPEQVHLSLTSGDYTKMGVSWVTLNDKRSVVQYGLSKASLTSVGDGTISTYRAAGWVGTIHRATMENLKPGTRYFYRVGNGLNRWSEIFDFTTMNPDDVVTFAIIADMDFDANATIANLNTLVQNGKVQCIVHSGDESYADGYEPHWDVFFNRIQSFAARVPYMATPGNHEFWYNFTSYKHRFFFPGALDQGGSGDGMFYSWNAGLTHFVAGNSETPIDTANFSSAFLTYLEKDLASVDRAVTPFVVVHFHRPMYCSNDDACTSKGGDRLRRLAEKTLYDYKVDFVITGHVHSYERTYPMYLSASTQHDYNQPQAPVYIMQGGSGNREGNKGYPTNLPEWSAGRARDVGFGLLTIQPKQADFQYWASSMNGPTMIDQFTLTK